MTDTKNKKNERLVVEVIADRIKNGGYVMCVDDAACIPYSLAITHWVRDTKPFRSKTLAGVDASYFVSSTSPGILSEDTFAYLSIAEDDVKEGEVRLAVASVHSLIDRESLTIIHPGLYKALRKRMCLKGYERRVETVPA